ncbi:MAG: cysteine hydrolase [Deltaproteobacteria bacterium]|nr:MAG: cysteine hydrolase [Deltaproteobacteria bacterium]
MQGAIIVVDMLEDPLGDEHAYPIAPHGRAIIPTINQITVEARARRWPVIFACDSFLPDDFIFGGKMTPHSLRGTPGAQPVAELTREPADELLPKRRFSAFFKTDLDQTLRAKQVDTVVVCGIATHFCVITTALDALCHDFRVILVEDATAAYSPEIHERTLALYRRNPLYPLLRVMTAAQMLELPA